MWPGAGGGGEVAGRHGDASDASNVVGGGRWQVGCQSDASDAMRPGGGQVARAMRAMRASD